MVLEMSEVTVLTSGVAGHDRHRLGQRADLQGEIHADGVVHVEDDAAAAAPS